jgi:hypothetical protein
MKTNVQLHKENLPRGLIQREPSGLCKRAIAGCLIASFALFGLRQLAPPVEYALCSKANGIYTVDAVTPRAECLVVRGSRIASVGYLGMSMSSSC